MKRLITFLLTLCLVVSFVPLAYAEDGEGDATKEAVESDGLESFAPDGSIDIQEMIEQASFHVDSVLSLNEALEAAHDGDIIAVDTTIYCENYSNFEFSTNKKLILVCAFDYFPMFMFFEDAKISGFTFYGAYYSGTIYISSGNVIVEDCTFYGNYEKISQSIYAEAGNVAIKRCRFQDAIYTPIAIQERATASIEKCVLENNQSLAYGGAIWNCGKLSVVDSIIANNQGGQGGGICNVGTLIVDNCIFWNNASVNEEGADIFNERSWPNGGILTIRGEYVDAGFYNEDTKEKIDLPLESYEGHLELVYKSEEEPDLSGFEREEDTIPEAPQQSTDPGSQSGYDGEKSQEQPPVENNGQDQQITEGDDGQEQPKEGDEDTGTDTEQPQESPTSPSDGGTDSGHYTPPAHRWPSKPSTPSTSTTPEDKGKDEGTEVPVDDTPAKDAPRLVCNGAVIDTSKTIVLLGYGDGQLHETDSLTRAQLATIVYRLLDDESIALYSNAALTFTDVAADAWYATYVKVIQAAGIVNGVGDGKYDPDGTVTWAQIVTILTRFVEAQEIELQHIQYEGWATPSLKTAVALGWIEDNATLSPDAIISRGDLVQLVNGVLALYR